MIIDSYNFEEGHSYIIVNKDTNEKMMRKFVCKVGETENAFETYANYKAGLIKNVFRDPKSNYCMEIASDKMDDYIFMDAETKETIPQSSGRYPWGNSEKDNGNLFHCYYNAETNRIREELKDKKNRIAIEEEYGLKINTIYKIITNLVGTVFIPNNSDLKIYTVVGIYKGIVKDDDGDYSFRFWCKLAKEVIGDDKDCYYDLDIVSFKTALSINSACKIAGMTKNPVIEVKPLIRMFEQFDINDNLSSQLRLEGVEKGFYYRNEIVDDGESKKIKIYILNSIKEGTCKNDHFIVEYTKDFNYKSLENFKKETKNKAEKETKNKAEKYINADKEMISKLMEIVKKNSKSTPNNLTPFKRVNICQNNHSYAFINKKDNNEYIIVQKYLSDKNLNINFSEYDIYDLGIHDYVRNALYKIDTNFICYEKMHPYLCLLGIYQGIVKTNTVSGYALRFLCKIPDAFNENKENCFLDIDISLLNKAMNGTIAQYFYAELIAKPLDVINPSEIMREDLVPTGLTKATYYRYEVSDFKDCKEIKLCFLTDNYEGTCANSAFTIEYKKKPV